MVGQDGEKHNPIASVMEFWDKVVADMNATAEEYKEKGWETLELHPGDVTTLTKDSKSQKYGLDVLVPGDEMDSVEELIDEKEVEFTSFEVYKALGSELVYVVVVMKDDEKEIALLYPAYYSADTKMLRDAQSEGVLTTYIRDLSEDRVVKLNQDDVSLFMAEDESKSEEEKDEKPN